MPVALNLFYLAIILHPLVETMPVPQKDSTDRLASELVVSGMFGVPPTVWVPIFVSLLTIYAIPLMIETSYAFTTIVIMHALLFVPLIAPPPQSISPSFSPVISKAVSRKLYLTISLLCLAIRLQTTLPPFVRRTKGHWTSNIEMYDVFTSYIAELFSALKSNPAQSSIGFDVLWTALSWFVWGFIAPGRRQAAYSNSRWRKTAFVVDKIQCVVVVVYVSLAVLAPIEPAGDAL